MRIGQTTDTFLPVVDGVGRVALAYSETLSRMGHQVTVIAPMNDTGHRGGYPFELVDFQAVSMPGMKQYKAGEAPLDPHYRARMRMIPLDIVHSHSPFIAGSEALRLAAQRNLPLVATFHSKYYDDFLKLTKSETLAKVGVKFVVDFYDRCDEVWAVGDATADVLREYGYQGQVQVMPNGVVMRNAEKGAVEEVNRRWGLSHDPLILFVGQMNWKKNILTVLEACAKMRRENKRFQLILAGQGPDLKEIEQKIYDLDIASRTHLAGHITDNRLLDGLYSRACIFAFPSLYDNAPMVVREAAVMGTPTVMVRGSSAAEIVEDEVNGFLCENSAEDLYRVLVKATQDPAASKLIGEKARETIPVPWEKILERAVERYERLIALNREGKLNKKYQRIV